MTSWWYYNEYLPRQFAIEEGDRRHRFETNHCRSWEKKIEELYWDARKKHPEHAKTAFWRAVRNVTGKKEKLNARELPSIREERKRKEQAFDEKAERFENLLEMWNNGDHQAVWEELLRKGVEKRDLDGNPIFPEEWIPRKGPQGGRYWEHFESGEKRHQLEKPQKNYEHHPDHELQWRSREEAKQIKEWRKENERESQGTNPHSWLEGIE